VVSSWRGADVVSVAVWIAALVVAAGWCVVWELAFLGLINYYQGQNNASSSQQTQPNDDGECEGTPECHLGTGLVVTPTPPDDAMPRGA
jgi:hypothetical protein